MRKNRKMGGVLLVAAAILGLWSGAGVWAADDAAKAKHETDVVWDGVRGSVGLGDTPVVAAQPGSGAAQQDFPGLEKRARAEVPSPAVNKGGARRGRRGALLLAVVALGLMGLALVGCGTKPPTEVTPAEACNVVTKSVQALNNEVNDVQLAAEKSGTFANTTWSVGDMQATTTSGWARKWDIETGEWVTVWETKTVESRFQTSQEAAQRQINSAENSIRSAGDKLAKATVYAAKCGPKATESMNAARVSLEKARQAVADAKAAINAAPNSEAAKIAARNAQQFAAEAYAKASEAATLAAEAAAEVHVS